MYDSVVEVEVTLKMNVTVDAKTELGAKSEALGLIERKKQNWLGNDGKVDVYDADVDVVYVDVDEV